MTTVEAVEPSGSSYLLNFRTHMSVFQVPPLVEIINAVDSLYPNERFIILVNKKKLFLYAGILI